MIAYLKIYFLWFIPLVAVGYGLIGVFAPIATVLLLSAIFVPSDRVRMSIIKSGKELPEPKLGWILVFLFSIIPFTFGVYSSSIGELVSYQHRPNVVVGAVFFWGIFTFGVNCILFKSNWYWRNTSKRITNK